MVDILIRPGLQAEVDTADILRAARAALRHQAAPPQASLCIVIAGDAEIRALNRQYRGIDAPTDVLSFAMQDDLPAAASPEEHAEDFAFIVASEEASEADAYLGDVIVSLPRVVSQAAELGHSTAQELRLLIVHGVLHLLGHDHATPQDEAQMWAIQDEILETMGTADDASVFH